MQCLLYHNQLWTWCKVNAELWSVLGASRMSKLSDDHHLRARLTFFICNPVWTKRFSNSDKLSHLPFSQPHPSHCPAWSHFTDSACPENLLNVWCSLQCNCFGRSVSQLWPINATSCDAQELTAVPSPPHWLPITSSFKARTFMQLQLRCPQRYTQVGLH